MATETSLFTGPLMTAAARDAFVKLDPRLLIRNPVMFVTAIVAALVLVVLVRDQQITQLVIDQLGGLPVAAAPVGSSVLQATLQ